MDFKEKLKTLVSKPLLRIGVTAAALDNADGIGHVISPTDGAGGSELDDDIVSGLDTSTVVLERISASAAASAEAANGGGGSCWQQLQLGDPEAEREVMDSIEPIMFMCEQPEEICYKQLLMFPSRADVNLVQAQRKRLRHQMAVLSKRVSDIILQCQPDHTRELERVMLIQEQVCQSLAVCGTARQSVQHASRLLADTELGVLFNYRHRHNLRAVLVALNSIRQLRRAECRVLQLLRAEHYPAAIELLLQCAAQCAGQHSAFSCVRQLEARLRDTLESTEEQLDVGLSKLCLNYDNSLYSRLQCSYQLLGKICMAADQLLMHFTSCIHSCSAQLLLECVAGEQQLQQQRRQLQSASVGTLEESADDTAAAAASAANGTRRRQYHELCAALPSSELLSCLTQLCERMWCIMYNFHCVLQWHAHNTDTHSQSQHSCPTVAVSEATDVSDVPLDGVYVSHKLQQGRQRVWLDVQGRVKTLLAAADVMRLTFDDFIAIIDVVNRLLHIGSELCRVDVSTGAGTTITSATAVDTATSATTAIAAADTATATTTTATATTATATTVTTTTTTTATTNAATTTVTAPCAAPADCPLRRMLLRHCAAFFAAYHRHRLDELSVFLAQEMWHVCPVEPSFSIDTLQEFKPLRHQKLQLLQPPPPAAPSDSGVVKHCGDDNSTPAEGAAARRATRHSLTGAFFSRFDANNTPFSVSIVDSIATNNATSHEQACSSSDNGADDVKVVESVKREPQSSAARDSMNSPAAPQLSPLLSSTALNLLRLCARYVTMMTLLHDVSTDIVAGLANLFDFYLCSVYSLFAQPDDSACSPRLRAAITRIRRQLFAAGPGAGCSSGSSSAGQAGGASTGASGGLTGPATPIAKSVDFARSVAASMSPSKSASFQHSKLASLPHSKSSSALASTLAHHQQQQQQQRVATSSSTVTASQSTESVTTAATHEPDSVLSLGLAAPALDSSLDTCSPHSLYGLEYRLVAMESLAFLADQMRLLRPLLQTGLPSEHQSHSLHKFFEQSVDVAADVRACVYHPVTSRVINTDVILTRMAAVNWEVNELCSQHSGYVDLMFQDLRVFNDRLLVINEKLPLPAAAYRTIWSQCISVCHQTFLDGFGAVRRCSGEGRGLMQLDFQQFVMQAETMAAAVAARLVAPLKPVAARSPLVDNYVKAFYVPESALEQWVREHREYSRRHILSLIECMHTSRKTKALIVSVLDETAR